MNITLIGLGGADKAIVSRMLAKSMDKKLICIEEEIAKKTKPLLKSLNKYSINRLIDIETEVVENISGYDECVFEANESIVMRNENINNLKKNGLIVLLTSTQKQRMLPKKPSVHIQKRLMGLKSLAECEYRCKRAADYIIDASNLSPEEICNLIMHYVQMELQ